MCGKKSNVFKNISEILIKLDLEINTTYVLHAMVFIFIIETVLLKHLFSTYCVCNTHTSNYVHEMVKKTRTHKIIFVAGK